MILEGGRGGIIPGSIFLEVYRGLGFSFMYIHFLGSLKFYFDIGAEKQVNNERHIYFFNYLQKKTT